MKKLKIKIFAIIFSILSLFIFGVFTINSIREYSTQRDNLNRILSRDFKLSKNNLKIKPDGNPREIFLDYTIYTILLDSNGNYLDIVNHTNNENIDEKYITDIAYKIIDDDKKSYVSNLLFNSYSFSFNDDNTLTIIDNSNQTQRMQKYFLITIVNIIILELIAYFLTKFLSKWTTDPVNESFEREKRFIADASHELKTPISVIMASVDAFDNDHNNKWIMNIKSESERMSKLVKNLLDLNKLENNFEIDKKRENLSKIIENAILTFESLFYENKIKLEYNISPNIYFYCNCESMKELMSVLIDNAIKYSDIKGKITVNLFIEEKNIVLEVKNKGIPIAKNDTEKIFERFYKVDKSRNRVFDNYGLGLSIAKRIVELHNGTISAISERRITTFKIVLSQK